MQSYNDDAERIEQFYRLLADYGLTGRSQPSHRQYGSDPDDMLSSGK